MRIFQAIGVCLLLLLLPGPLQAEPVPVPLRISVLTMGPGSDAFARFGHNALLVELEGNARDPVYNFGTFSFDGLNGVKDFMAGRFRYWLSVSSLGRTARFYNSRNRTLVAQELNLTPEERVRLFQALEENAIPENSFYDYDYYRDNCSTRVRDAIDKVLGGELTRGIQGPGRLSFREHTNRLVGEDLWLSLGLDIALGPLTDKPTTRWEETFIPSELHDALAASSRTLEGKRVPMVRSERTLLTADREPIQPEPPQRIPAFFAFGTLLGGVLFLLGRAAKKVVAARVAFGVLSAVLGLVLGLLGTVFVVFWAFTKHWSAYRNENILVCPPFALIFVALGVAIALNRPGSVQKAHRWFTYCAVSALLAVLLALIPNFGQDNTRIAALLAPIWLGLFAGSTVLSGRSITRPFAVPNAVPIASESDSR